MMIMQTRRRFLGTMALGGAAGMLPFPQARAAEPAPEVTTVRLGKIPVICFAPQYVCEDLLRLEGFTDIRYVDITKASDIGKDLAEGKYDFASDVTASNIVFVDSGLPITLSPVSMPGVTSCLPATASAISATSKENGSARPWRPICSR
jgi:NitT/TauT family transport system substrate-binding protein